MKAKISLLLFISLVMFGAKAQSYQETLDYYNLKVDELVSKWQNVSDEFEEDKTNHVYAKVFTSPVLYNSVVEKAVEVSEEETAVDFLEMDDKRAGVIDELMLNLYKTAPEKVEMTEEQLRDSKMVPENVSSAIAPVLKMSKVFVPSNVEGGMKTTVVKPNYWKFSGSSSLTFTQSFISDNWYQGGEKNYYAMLATLDLDMNYDDQNRITWTNHFDFDLGFATYQDGTKLGMKTNTDKLRLESTCGYKLVKALDLAAKLKVESQSLPNYQVGTRDLISACLSPLDANASIGLNYKPDLGNFKLEVYLAPFSGYNLRYVYHDELTEAYGLGEKHLKQDFGTQLVVTVPTYQITSFLDVYSRLEYYTNYHRAFFQWEAKFNLALSKYFTASLMLNTRFDDSVTFDENWKFWQLKELFTLGVAYKW